MKTINTDQAPAPIGPYNQAIVAGGMLYCSGQIAIDPHTGELFKGDIGEETHMVMKNLEALLKEAGSSFDQVVKCSIFLNDMGQFAQVNEVYGSYFGTHFPARECVEVSVLPKHVNVEISAIAQVA